MKSLPWGPILSLAGSAVIMVITVAELLCWPHGLRGRWRRWSVQRYMREMDRCFDKQDGERGSGGGASSLDSSALRRRPTFHERE